MSKLNRKLAEWAGFYTTELFGDGYWWRPDGYAHGSYLPDFTESLDACFKWLAPELTKRIGWSRTKSLLQKWIGYAEFDYEKDVLALCLAIEKLIDGGE